jgi:hypothetical protein
MLLFSAVSVAYLMTATAVSGWRLHVETRAQQCANSNASAGCIVACILLLWVYRCIAEPVS